MKIAHVCSVYHIRRLRVVGVGGLEILPLLYYNFPKAVGTHLVMLDA